jgi:hypothetical protein
MVDGGEQQDVGHRHQRSALPASGHITRPEPAHHLYAEALG